MKCGQVAVLESCYTLLERIASQKMSYIFKQIGRGINRFRVLFFIALIVFSTTDRATAADPIDEPKPYSKCWSIDTLPDLSTYGAADNTSLYFFTADGALEAVDQKSGARLWSTDLAGSVVSNLLLTDHAAIFMTAGRSENGAPGKSTLRAVSKQTGITIWSTSVQGAITTTLGSVGDKLAAVNGDGVVSVYSASNGSLVRNQPIGARVVTTPLFASGHIVLGTDANELIAVDVTKGVVTRLLRTSRPPTAVFVDSEGRMLVGDARGNLGFTSAGGDPIWTFKNGAQISFLLPYDAEYLAASFDNFIYKLSRSGGVEWKRRLSGRLSSRPLIIGHDGVISITGDPTVYVLDLSSGKILNQIEIGSDENSSPRVVAAGTNGFAVAGAQGIQFFSREACPQK